MPEQIVTQQTRRAFLERGTLGLGAMAVASLLRAEQPRPADIPGPTGLPHFAPRARRVIYLFQSGGPAQMDLFDYKPELA
ncbi:MAG: sulfatase, partial [Planctomycetota bacterium]|nr:sulfatase [Planctomycetota bacterium]